MKLLPIPALACAALVALAPSRPGLPQGALKRLDPAPQERGTKDDFLARDFDRGRWNERLTDADLDRRQESFQKLLMRARIDPVARAYIEEQAQAPEGGELAWTARLALRELGRARFPLQGPGAGPFGRGRAFAIEPFSSEPFQEIQGMLNEMLRQDGGLSALMHRGHPGQTTPPPGVSGRSVRVEQGPAGTHIEVLETVGGDTHPRIYEGPDLGTILHENPELARELDGLQLQLSPGSRMDLRFDLPGDQRGETRTPTGRGGLLLEPQGLSRPRVTDRLGVIVQPLDSARAQELGLERQGLLVEQAYPETYAALLGVRAGSILLELQGVPLRAPEDIEHVMAGRGPDDALRLVWLDELGQRRDKIWTPPPAEPLPPGPLGPR